MRLNYPDSININGNKATHIHDGIYKVDNPFIINIESWTHDENNYGYTVLGCNYSSDYTTCEVHYFSKENNNQIVKLRDELNKNNSNRYGYIQCIRYDMTPRIGGGIILEI